jgi:integrase
MPSSSSSPKTGKRHRLDPRKVRIKGKILWQVDLGSGIKDGHRHRLRRTFANREEADTFSRLKKIERENRGTAGISMPERLRGEAIEADRLLAPFGVSILDLAREYAQRMEQSAKSETAGNAFTAFMAAKTGDNLRARYLSDLRSRVGRFVESFKDRKLADIAPAEIDRYLRELGVRPLSRNTVRMRLSVFFEYCRKRSWVQANPLPDVSKAKVTASVPGILSVEQVARLLEAASEETLPFLAIGAFAGLRSAEIERLEWRHVRFEERLIEVPALSSKTAARRLVTMQANLLQWLSPYRGRDGWICPGNLARRLMADREAAGITEWPSNGLRHSYASYYLAAFKDAPALSLELGHVRPQTVFAHYRELVRPSEAERFWKIVPAVQSETIAVVA